MPRLGKCVDCNLDGIIGGRGLCKACHKYNKNRHTLDNFPRSTWKNEDLMAELQLCLRRGLSVREAAEKIGVGHSALRKAMERARARDLPSVGPRSS